MLDELASNFLNDTKDQANSTLKENRVSEFEHNFEEKSISESQIRDQDEHNQYSLSVIEKNEEANEYEPIIQKYEADIRSHIRAESEMKLYVESL